MNQTQIEVIPTIIVRDLTLEELRGCKLDSAKLSIFVRFASDFGLSYLVTHIHPGGSSLPYIQPYTAFKPDEETQMTASELRQFTNAAFVDLDSTLDSLVEITGARREDLIRVNGNGIFGRVRLDRLTTQDLARFVDTYMGRFNYVSVPIGYFRDVPRNSLESSGLPVRRIILR